MWQVHMARHFCPPLWGRVGVGGREVVARAALRLESFSRNRPKACFALGIICRRPRAVGAETIARILAERSQGGSWNQWLGFIIPPYSSKFGEKADRCSEVHKGIAP